MVANSVEETAFDGIYFRNLLRYKNSIVPTPTGGNSHTFGTSSRIQASPLLMLRAKLLALKP